VTMLDQLLATLDNIATRYPTLTGICLVTIAFFAGYADFQRSRPAGLTWFWWGWGLLGIVGYIGFLLHSGHPGAVFQLCIYFIAVGPFVWRHLRRRYLRNGEQSLPGAR
jgi:hypothetical protein